MYIGCAKVVVDGVDDDELKKIGAVVAPENEKYYAYNDWLNCWHALMQQSGPVSLIEG